MGVVERQTLRNREKTGLMAFLFPPTCGERERRKFNANDTGGENESSVSSFLQLRHPSPRDPGISLFHSGDRLLGNASETPTVSEFPLTQRYGGMGSSFSRFPTKRH